MLRIIQWATGAVGRHAVAAVHRHPELELVGAYVYSDAKAGRDVGDVCGIGAIGVTATRDPEKILALDADCVLYMPLGEMNPSGALDDICRLLASGKNVVSTAVTALIYPKSMGQTRGGSPGSRLCRRAFVIPRHRHRARLGRRGAPAHHVGDLPAHRLAARPGNHGLLELQEPRGALRHHGLRKASGRAGADGQPGRARSDVLGAADAARRRPGRHASTTSNTSGRSPSRIRPSMSRSATSRPARWRRNASASPPSSADARH